MTNHIPPYLRLHNDAPDAVFPASDELRTLADALGQAIGWLIDVDHQRANEGEEQATESFPCLPFSLGANVGFAEGDATAISRAAAQGLVTAVNELYGELQRTRRALWEREAELAAAVPVTPRPDEETHLAERLETILRSGVEAVGASAAALYLLNDDTTELKVRACWGLPKTRLLDDARPLRGAVADLEALVGHAVVLEDTSLLSHWKVPEQGFPTALCVPVSSPTSPLGTLWLFSKEPRDFTIEQTNMVEIVAGRLAADLDREVLMHEGVSGQDLRRQRDIVASSQFDRLPSISPLLDDWDVAGWSTPSDEVMGDFYDWTVLPDGRLALAVGDAMGRGLEAAMTAANLQTALKAHGCYRHDARQMVARLNETLWTSSAGDQFASLFYCLIEPETGQLEYASAGKVAALLTNNATPMFGACLPLGTQPEDTFRNDQAHIARGGTLLLISEGLLPLAQPSGRRRSILSQLIDDAETASAQELAEAVRSQMLAKLTPIQRDCTVVVAKRSLELPRLEDGDRDLF